MPKNGSANLFQLIKALSKEERGYFNLTYNQGNAPIHAQVFNFMLQQDKFNEKELIKALGINTSRLPNIKNYLYHRILENLGNLNKNKSLSSEIRTLLNYAEILQNKNLLSQSLRFILKAKNLARESDYFAYQLEGIDMELNNGVKRSDLKWMKFYSKILFEQKSNILNQILNADEYSKVSMKLILAGRRYEHPKGIKENVVFKKIMGNKYLVNEKAAISARARIDLYHIKGGYHYAIGEFRKAISCFRKEVTYISANPFRKERFIGTYIKACSNIVACGIGILRFEELLFFLDEIKFAIQNKIKYSSPDMLAMYYNGYLAVHINYSRFEEAMDIIEEINVWININEKVLSGHAKNYILFLISQIYFWNHKLKESSRCINKCMPERNISTELTLYADIILFNLILQYELKNYDILESLILSTSRFLIKSNRMTHVSKALIDFMRKSPHVASKKELSILLYKLKNELKKKRNKNESDFNLTAWVESKL